VIAEDEDDQAGERSGHGGDSAASEVLAKG
jgi:hypothetical protein